jgi:hypothetical protein
MLSVHGFQIILGLSVSSHPIHIQQGFGLFLLQKSHLHCTGTIPLYFSLIVQRSFQHFWHLVRFFFRIIMIFRIENKKLFYPKTKSLWVAHLSLVLGLDGAPYREAGCWDSTNEPVLFYLLLMYCKYNNIKDICNRIEKKYFRRVTKWILMESNYKKNS